MACIGIFLHSSYIKQRCTYLGLLQVHAEFARIAAGRSDYEQCFKPPESSVLPKIGPFSHSLALGLFV